MIIVLERLISGAKELCESRLDGAITSTATSLSVVTNTGSYFPDYDPVFLQCESEIMKRTAHSSDTFTVERGVEGTAAASHADDKPIIAIECSNRLNHDRIVCNNNAVVCHDNNVVYN